MSGNTEGDIALGAPESVNRSEWTIIYSNGARLVLEGGWNGGMSLLWRDYQYYLRHGSLPNGGEPRDYRIQYGNNRPEEQHIVTIDLKSIITISRKI